MSDDFASPGSVAGITYGDIQGHLLLIEPIAFEKDIPTTLGNKDAVRADVYDLTEGTAYTDTLIFPRVLASSLRGRIGQKVLARLGQGVAKPGQNAPWILEDASGDASAVAQAKAYLANRGPSFSAPVGGSTPASNVAQVFGGGAAQSAPPF